MCTIFGGSTGCSVLGIEVQSDLHNTAITLTKRTKLSDKVTHMGGDFLQLGQYLSMSKYDAIVSWLTILHFQNQDAVFNLAMNLLRPGGKFYAQDFATDERGLNVRERTLLSKKSFATGCYPKISTYIVLHSCGFRNIAIEDVTSDWAKFTMSRARDWQEKKRKS